jgi:hypothetical protein
MFQSVVNFTKVEPEDVEYVAAHVREADRVEVFESSKRDVLKALSSSVVRSERTAAIHVDGVPVAVFGVGRLSLTSDVGVPWMLGTEGLRAHAKLLLPLAKPMVGKMMKGHSVLRNMVHDDNKASIRWLRSMGFRFSEPMKLGWRGAMFRVFELTEGELHV